jgi:hypothetical protein
MSSSGKTGLRCEAIRRSLAQRHGQDPGAGAIAGAALGLWREVADCLAPLIGSRGVDALVRRSLQLTTPAFPWLGLSGERADGLGPLTGIKPLLEARDPMAATEASVALLVAFTDMLATMIGASLTDRLLDPIWTSPPPKLPEETAS